MLYMKSKILLNTKWDQKNIHNLDKKNMTSKEESEKL